MARRTEHGPPVPDESGPYEVLEMLAITARYRPATNTRGSRYLVDDGRTRSTHAYDYSSSDAARSAILAHIERSPLDWQGYRLAFGQLPNGDTVAVIVGTRYGDLDTFVAPEVTE